MAFSRMRLRVSNAVSRLDAAWLAEGGVCVSCGHLVAMSWPHACLKLEIRLDAKQSWEMDFA